jgi:hypothetical protein
MTVEYLVPSANATTTTTQILATNDYTLINEGLTTPNGSVNDTNIDNTSTAGTDAIWALTDLAGFGTLNSATFRVRARFVNPGSGDTATYQFQLAIGGDVFNLTYSTAVDENNGFTDYSTVLSGGSYPYTEAQFNAATVTLTQTVYTKDMGADGLYLDVDAFELEVDWTPVASGVTVTPTGVEGTGAVDTPTLHGKANTGVTGLEATAVSDSVTTGISKTYVPNGLEATTGFDPVSVTAVRAPTIVGVGSEATAVSAAATVAAEANIPILGLEATGESDSVSLVGEANFTVAGLEATGYATPVTVAVLNASWEQEGFRFRNDDGTEITASWVAAQDTNVSLIPETNYRLRITSVATADPPSATATLQYRKVGDADWHTIV